MRGFFYAMCQAKHVFLSQVNNYQKKSIPEPLDLRLKKSRCLQVELSSRRPEIFKFLLVLLIISSSNLLSLPNFKGSLTAQTDYRINFFSV